MTLAELWKKVQRDGPSHILLDKDGTTLMAAQALQKNPDQSWDLIYFRNDGYTLACDFYLAQHAEALHRKDWLAVAYRGAQGRGGSLLPPKLLPPVT